MTFARSSSAQRTIERPAGAAFAPQYFEFGDLEPDEMSVRGTKTWITCAARRCASPTPMSRRETRSTRAGQPDEYMVLLPSPGAAGVAKAGGQSDAIAGKSVVVMPPGDSELVVDSGGEVIRIFSTQADDLVAECRNRDVYQTPDPNVAAWQPWPDPPAGHRIRVYPLDAIPQDSGRFGRLLRCSTIMVNYFYPDDGARDPQQAEPAPPRRLRADLAAARRDYVHHIRTPWTVDMDTGATTTTTTATSRPSPIIPPPTIHTSQRHARRCAIS